MMPDVAISVICFGLIRALLVNFIIYGVYVVFIPILITAVKLDIFFDISHQCPIFYAANWQIGIRV